MTISLDEILAMGYSGYATINNTPIPLLSSSVAEEDNLINSSDPFSTVAELAAGTMVAKDRRALRITLNTELSQSNLHLIGDLTFGPWRNSTSITSATPTEINIYKGSGEGYKSSSYVDRVSLKVGNAGAITFSIQATAWVWTDLNAGTVAQKQGFGVQTYQNQYKPVPHWLGTIDTNLVPSSSNNGTVLEWDLNLNNNWQFDHLLEATLEPPNPAQIYPGPLEGDLSLKWLARKDCRPKESGNAIIRIKDPSSRAHPDILTINLPLLVRESRNTDALGEGNSPVKWEASYKLLRVNPF